MRARSQTYAITAVCHQRRRIFQKTSHAELLIGTIFRYRDLEKYRLHGFVIMPDHLHVLVSPAETAERAIQLIKGGYSFALRTHYAGEVWQTGYHAHRVTGPEDLQNQLAYIAQNPVKLRLPDYPHVHTRFIDRLDPLPQIEPTRRLQV